MSVFHPRILFCIQPYRKGIHVLCQKDFCSHSFAYCSHPLISTYFAAYVIPKCLGLSFLIYLSYCLRSYLFVCSRLQKAQSSPTSHLLFLFSCSKFHFIFFMNNFCPSFPSHLFRFPSRSQINISDQHIASPFIVSPKTPFSTILRSRSPIKRPHQGSTPRR
jgi:hypothetical protein